jgi:ribosomal protein S18 acetylase RimI-like enzyme
MQEARVRRMASGDIEEALQLTESVAAERIWIGTEPGFDRERYASRWRMRIGQPSSAVLVATVGDRIVGFGDVYPDAEHGQLLGMFVDKDFRGCGIGRLLLKGLVDWARERDLPNISLHVFPHNDRAIALYKSAGFLETTRVPDHSTRRSGEVWEAILMTKALGPPDPRRY